MTGSEPVGVSSGLILSADAVGFVPLVESLSPQEAGRVLSSLQQDFYDQALVAGGHVVDIIADALLVHWPGEELAVSQHVVTAIGLAHKLAGEQSLPMRVGLHAGEYLICDRPGMHDCYQLVGDPVNTAHRLQTLNKLLGTSVLCSESVVRHVEDYPVRSLGEYRLKGKHRPLRVFEVMDDREDQHQLSRAFGRALASLEAGDHVSGRAGLQAVLADFPHDGPSHFLLEQVGRLDSTLPGFPLDLGRSEI